MEEVVFECEVITPMFLAGADGTTPEIRAPSIKGAMRFWWRAANGHLPLEELKKKEAELFGSSDEGIGKSKVRLRVEHGKIKSSTERFPSHSIKVTHKGKTFPINILEYLAYGTYKYERGRGNIFIREYIPYKEKFRIILSFSQTVSNTQKEEVLKSMYLLFGFGGLGSRSRNGFGSIYNSKKSIDRIVLFKKHKKGDLPEYTAFSGQAKLWQTKREYDTWDKALAEIGKIYREARLSLENSHSYEKRQYIASPIMVGRTQVSQFSRYAKPYFLSVKPENNEYIGQILYLPSQYAYGKGGVEDTEGEIENFLKVTKEFNNKLSKRLEEVGL